MRRGAVALGALGALGLVVASCSTTDDVGGVEEIAVTAAASDAPADGDASDDEEATPADSEPADDVVDGFEFIAPTGDYSIVFPGEPTATPIPVPLPTGQETAEAFIWEDGLDAAYFSSVFSYPQGATDDDPQVVLAGARDGAIANVGGTLIESEFIETDGVPGVSFTFEVDDGTQSGDGNALVYFDAPKLYQTFALGFAGQSDRFQAFLDTFMFLDTDTAGDS